MVIYYWITEKHKGSFVVLSSNNSIYLILLLSTLIFAWWYFNRTTYGRSTFIIGEVPSLAKKSGMNRGKIIIVASIIASVMMSMTSLCLIHRTIIPNLFDSNTLTYQMITAATICGRNTLNPRNIVFRSLLATSELVLLEAIIQLLGLSSSGVLSIFGIIILSTLYLDRSHQRT